MAGRKVIPIRVNRKHFTNQEKEKRARAENRLKGGTDKIRPPSWLDATAKKEFRKLATELIKIKILCNSDVGGLAIACDAYSKYIMATSAITPETINALITVMAETPIKTTTVKKNPLNAVEKYADIYRMYCAEYGLTPSARIKLSAGIPDEPPADAGEQEMFGDA